MGVGDVPVDKSLKTTGSINSSADETVFTVEASDGSLVDTFITGLYGDSVGVVFARRTSSITSDGILVLSEKRSLSDDSSFAGNSEVRPATNTFVAKSIDELLAFCDNLGLDGDIKSLGVDVDICDTTVTFSVADDVAELALILIDSCDVLSETVGVVEVVEDGIFRKCSTEVISSSTLISSCARLYCTCS